MANPNFAGPLGLATCLGKCLGIAIVAMAGAAGP